MNHSAMLLMLAAQMSEQDIVNEIELALGEYNDADSSKKDDASQKLAFTCMLFMSKQAAPDMDTAIKAIKQVDEIEQLVGKRPSDEVEQIPEDNSLN